MDAPADERKRFDHVTRLMSSSVDEVSGKGCLALDIIEQVVPSFDLFSGDLSKRVRGYAKLTNSHVEQMPG